MKWLDAKRKAAQGPAENKALPGPPENKAAAAAEPETEPTIDATDAAIRLAGEHDIDLATVKGTGSGGRITAGDVQALIPD